MEKEVLFTEVQKFRQWWLWLIIIVASVPTIGILLYQVFTEIKVGTKPASNTMLALLSMMISVPMILGFYFIKLITIIDTEAIYYGFSFSGKNLNEIRLTNIKKIEVIQYEANGFGLRLKDEYGTIYNTSGNKGLFIVNEKGAKILIGTRRPEVLKAIIDKIDVK